MRIPVVPLPFDLSARTLVSPSARQRTLWLAVAGFVYCSVPLHAAGPPDGIHLTASKGTQPSDVALAWDTGPYTFAVYRSTDAATVLDPANNLGGTTNHAWTDSPPSGAIFFYTVTSSCAYHPPEICDGVDDDCDGIIDGPGSESSCSLPNATPQCVNGSCAIAACAPGFGDCDSAQANGCEADLSIDPNHCGACTNSCADTGACTVDTCAAGSCKHIDLRTCLAPPTSGEGGLGCASAAQPPGCWGTACTAGTVTLPPGCSQPDTDGDGLPDSWESDHAVDGNCDGDFSDLGPGGSDLALPDDPGWEEVNQKNAYIVYDYMESAGVEAQHKPMDGFIGKDYDGVTDAPVKGTLTRVIDAYALKGIRLKIEPNTNPSRINPTNPTGVTSPLPHTTVVSFANPIGTCATNAGANTAVSFYDLKSQNFDLRNKFTHKYAVFAHNVQCSGNCASPECVAEGQSLGQCAPVRENTTGLAELGGEDIVVTLGGQGLDDGSTLPEPQRTASRDKLIKYQAGTMMHELGHTFGLDHGGANPTRTCDPNASSAINRKPNYISVMQYALQTSGIRTAATNCSTTPIPPNPSYAQLDPGAWRVDYSSVPLPPPLMENFLLESEGISSCACGLTDGLRDISLAYEGCSGVPVPIPGCGPVDWNRNGVTPDPEPVSVDINQDSLDDPSLSCPNLSTLEGFDDWTYVKGHMAFQCGSNFVDGSPLHQFPSSKEADKQLLIDMGLEGVSSFEGRSESGKP